MSHACCPIVAFPHLCCPLVRSKFASICHHFPCPETAQQSWESAGGSIIPVHPAGGSQRERGREPACATQRSKSMTKPSGTGRHSVTASRRFPRRCFTTLLFVAVVVGHQQLAIRTSTRQVQKKTALGGQTGGPTLQWKSVGEKMEWRGLDKPHPQSLGPWLECRMRMACPGSRASAPS